MTQSSTWAGSNVGPSPEIQRQNQVNDYLRKMLEEVRNGTSPALAPRNYPEPAEADPEAPQPVPVADTGPEREGRADRAGVIATLPFRLRAALQMALDLDVPTHDMVYTVLWAPAVAADMAFRESGPAYLSRDELEAVTGLNGPGLMRAGGIVERSGTVGLVHMVTRGVPGAVTLPDGSRRGIATSWGLSMPLDDFQHTPARIGAPRKVATIGPEYLRGSELEGMAVWLNPRHPWWGPKTAGLTGWRLTAALVARYGVVDVLINPVDAGRLIGRTRMPMLMVLRRLAELGIAVRQDGMWRVKLGSRLGRITADDLKHDPVRAPRPSLARAKSHDYGWFTDEGRSIRATARNILGNVRSGALRLDADSCWAVWAAMPRGGFIAAFEYVRVQREEMAKRGAARMAAYRAAQALTPDPGAVSRERRLQAASSARESLSGGPGDGLSIAEKMALLRRQAGQ